MGGLSETVDKSAEWGESKGLASRLAFPPTGRGGLPGDLLPPLGAHAFGPSLPAHPAQFLGGLVLAVVSGELFFDLAGRQPHDVDGVADHVAGAALAFGASGHFNRFSPSAE
jgi:hypothetical protein